MDQGWFAAIGQGSEGARSLPEVFQQKCRGHVPEPHSAQQWHEHPELEAEEFRQPVFIVGISRTRTTYLLRLMYFDEGFLDLRGYELIKPILPPEIDPDVAGSTEDPGRIYVEDMLEASGVTEVIEGLHHIDIDETEEEFGLMRQFFCS